MRKCFFSEFRPLGPIKSIYRKEREKSHINSRKFSIEENYGSEPSMDIRCCGPLNSFEFISRCSLSLALSCHVRKPYFTGFKVAHYGIIIEIDNTKRTPNIPVHNSCVSGRNSFFQSLSTSMMEMLCLH